MFDANRSFPLAQPSSLDDLLKLAEKTRQAIKLGRLFTFMAAHCFPLQDERGDEDGGGAVDSNGPRKTKTTSRKVAVRSTILWLHDVIKR